MSRQAFSVYVLCGRWALCGRLHVVLRVGMFSVGCVCVYVGFCFLCVVEHLFACVCMWVFELWELAREFGPYVL